MPFNLSRLVLAMSSIKVKEIHFEKGSSRNREPFLKQNFLFRGMSRFTIQVQPQSALVDEKVVICVKNATPDHPITLAAHVKENDNDFVSHGHYVTDMSGSIDISKDACLGGTYTGVEPMGLFWSMEPAPGQRYGLRLLKKNVSEPMRVTLVALDGHVSAVSDSKILFSCEVERWYLGKDVRRIPIREGRLRGTLFLPEGNGPFPGIIDMFGSSGGLIETRAALLASRGFAVFSLAYFGYEDLPEKAIMHLEYFEEAVDWFIQKQYVKPSGIGVIGVSLGAELAHYMAIHHPKVIACVAINGLHFNCDLVTYYEDGIKQPTGRVKWEEMEMKGNTRNAMKALQDVPGEDKAAIPVHKGRHAQVMLVYGGSDAMQGSYHYEHLVKRFLDHGRDNFELKVYPGAGHLLEPPYTPLNTVIYHKLSDGYLEMGGETVAHALAQEQSWKDILKFLSMHLDKDGLKTT